MTCEAPSARKTRFSAGRMKLIVLGLRFWRTNMEITSTMVVKFVNPLTDRIAGFLNEIGLTVRAGEIPERTFLPGIHVARGVLVVEESRLAYPGDLLHEAGHLAVTPAALRDSIDGDAGDYGGEEMAAIAWSYAAAVYLGLSPDVVFHAAGYRGGASNLIENFGAGRYIGVPFLKWIGLTDDAYPAMTRWLRD